MKAKVLFLVCGILSVLVLFSVFALRPPRGQRASSSPPPRSTIIPAAAGLWKKNATSTARRNSCSSVGCLGCIGADVCWACARGYAGVSCRECTEGLRPVGGGRGATGVFACIPEREKRKADKGEKIVTFVDSSPEYLALLDVMLESVAEFSTRRTLVVGVGWDPSDAPLFQRHRRVDTASLPVLWTGMHVWFSKITAMLTALETVEVAVLVEPDTVVSHRIDDLFELGQHIARLLPHPLFPRHIHDIGQNILPRVGVVAQVVSPIHAHMIATREHIPFLRRALELATTGRFESDEHVFNVLLQIYDVRWTAFLYDPFTGAANDRLATWLDGNNDTAPSEARNILVQGSFYKVALPHDSIGFVLVHGAKSSEVLRKQFAWLKALRSRSAKMYFDYTKGKWVESVWQLSNIGIVHTEETPLKPAYVPGGIPQPSSSVAWNEVW